MFAYVITKSGGWAFLPCLKSGVSSPQKDDDGMSDECSCTSKGTISVCAMCLSSLP